MPRNVYPPTPGSSSDIKGQDGSQKLATLQLAFELPPPALHDASPTSATSSISRSAFSSSTATTTADHKKQHAAPPPSPPAYPMQAAEAVKARRRSSAAAAAREMNFTLPPPPTRSRKIIQMKPPQEDGGAGAGASSSSSTATTATVGAKASKDSFKGKGKAGTAGTGKASGSGAGAASSAATDGPQGKKKQPSATSAAGRKIARKTAHSLIERRRRSKMNEEFALLKSMIPACTGEMHKLAILQASIEYVRYLEDCVNKLKAQHEDNQQSRASQAQLPSIHEFHPTFRDDLSGDVEMTDSEAAVSPTFTATPDQMGGGYMSRQPSISPALHAQDDRHRGRQPSYSSVSTEYRPLHGGGGYATSTTSAATSPVFGPQSQGGYIPAGLHSALTSPALNPQSDLDHEATAALLMLNSDRREYNANGGRRAVSVRDLLTT